jgi:hypothetical protein
MAARLLGSAGAAFAVSSPKLECVSPANGGFSARAWPSPWRARRPPSGFSEPALGCHYWITGPISPFAPDEAWSRGSRVTCPHNRAVADDPDGDFERVALVPGLLARRVLALATLRFRSERLKEIEILVLRHQLAVLRRQVSRPQLGDADRVFMAAASRLLPRRRWSVFLVRPETLLRWHRRLVARRWTYPARKPGRPALDPGIVELIVRLADRKSVV